MTFKEEYGETGLEDYDLSSEKQTSQIPNTKGRENMKPLTDNPIMNSVPQGPGVTVVTTEK